MIFDRKLIKQKGHTFTRAGIDEDCKEKNNVHLQNFKNKLKIETSFLFPVLYSQLLFQMLLWATPKRFLWTQ